jgi:hypothetical protein
MACDATPCSTRSAIESIPLSVLRGLLILHDSADEECVEQVAMRPCCHLLALCMRRRLLRSAGHGARSGWTCAVTKTFSSQSQEQWLTYHQCVAKMHHLRHD